MVTTPLSWTFSSVPVSLSGVLASVDGGGAVMSAPPLRSSAWARAPTSARTPTAAARLSALVLFTAPSPKPPLAHARPDARTRPARLARRSGRERLRLGRRRHVVLRRAELVR